VRNFSRSTTSLVRPVCVLQIENYSRSDITEGSAQGVRPHSGHRKSVMNGSLIECWMQFFTLYNFHTTAALRIIDQTSSGPPIVTIPGVGFLVTSQLAKIGDGRLLQYTLVVGFHFIQPPRNGSCQSPRRTFFRPA
jgi:hypothetical protein